MSNVARSTRSWHELLSDEDLAEEVLVVQGDATARVAQVVARVDGLPGQASAFEQGSLSRETGQPLAGCCCRSALPPRVSLSALTEH